jgi:hypothetical protein
MDRLKFLYERGKNRYDIIQASNEISYLDQSTIIFGKAKSLSKIIDKQKELNYYLVQKSI